MEDLALLSDDALLSGLEHALGATRLHEVRLLGYLAEVEERRLDLKAGYSSMFDFCKTKLHLSSSEAHRRLLGARLMRLFPMIAPLLETGAINITALELLRHHLTEENHRELLAEASFKTKEEIQELLARRYPRPDVPDSVRKVPERCPETPLLLGGAAEARELRLESPRPRGRSASEPLSPGRYAVSFTASAELRDKLELAKNLMSHSNPALDLAVVIERAVDLLLEKLEKKKLGKTDRPRKGREAKHGAVTQAARRAATERDGVRCAWVDPKTGRRCNARAFLEIDHVTAKALGGSGEPGNVRWLCHAHNRLHAEQTFGRDYVENAIHFRERKSAKSRAVSDAEAKAMKALTNMGFRAAEARTAVERVRSQHSEEQAEESIEHVLRAALSVLTEARARSS